MKKRNHDAGESRQQIPLRPSNLSFELLQKALEVIRRRVEKGNARAAKWVLVHKEEPANNAERVLCLDSYHAILNHFDRRLIHLLVTEVLTAEEFNCEVLPGRAELKENREHRNALEVIRAKLEKVTLGRPYGSLTTRKKRRTLQTDRCAWIPTMHAMLKSICP